MPKMQGKTVVVTGSSRGIGRAIALRFAREGANLVLASKTIEPHPQLEGTLGLVAEEVERLGGKAMTFQIDVRDASAIESLAQAVEAKFSDVHVLINNAGAIKLSDTEHTPAKSYDLMQQVNTRATFLMSRAFLPLLKNAGGGHIINLSPPISLESRWLENHLAYTLSKFGMSFCTLGMAQEFKPFSIAVNSLWPKSIIYTAAAVMLLGEGVKAQTRRPEIMADAAFLLASASPSVRTGSLLLDEEVLLQNGLQDFSPYQYEPGQKLMPDLFVS